jgi:hypothetical protein
MGSTVQFRGYTFPSNWSNVIVDGAPRTRVKEIYFPGTPGGFTLNMKTADRRVRHTGTVRRPSQASLNDTIDDINSICDGVRSTTTATSLKFHGRKYDSVFGNAPQWGAQYPGRGNGGISATTTSYFAVPFTIEYVQVKP